MLRALAIPHGLARFWFAKPKETKATLALAWSGKKIIGWCACVRWSHDSLPSEERCFPEMGSKHLLAWYVLPDYRRKGLAKAMVTTLASAKKLPKLLSMSPYYHLGSMMAEMGYYPVRMRTFGCWVYQKSKRKGVSSRLKAQWQRAQKLHHEFSVAGLALYTPEGARVWQQTCSLLFQDYR